MRRPFRTALAAFLANPTDASAAEDLILGFQAGVSMRTQIDEVEEAALAALRDVPRLIRARIVVVATQFIDGERTEQAALAEIAALKKKWRTVWM